MADPTSNRRKVLRCPECGSRLDRGGRFDLLTTHKILACGSVEGLDKYGDLVVEGVQFETVHTYATRLLACHDCGHEWSTTFERSLTDEIVDADPEEALDG